MSDAHLHDLGYRFLFADPVLLEQLLTTCVHTPWVRELDLSSIEPFPTTFIDRRLVRRDDDFVAKVRFRGHDAYLVILLEFQSSPDPFMALRLLTYQCLVWAAILERDEAIEHLPPVFPVVLYRGERPWDAPLQVADLVHPLAREHLSAYVPAYTYYLIDEHAFPERTAALAANFISVLFTLETARAEELQARLQPVAEWLHAMAESHPASVRRVLDWISARFHADNRRAGEVRPEDIAAPEELRSMLERTIQELKDRSRQEGWQEGRREEQRRIALRLLAQGADPMQVAELVGLPIDEVRKLTH